MEFTQTLGYKVHQVVLIMDKLADVFLQQHLQLSYAHFLVLIIVHQCQTCSQKDIAAQLTLTEAAISRQVEYLANQGWLHVELNSENRRQHLLSLTPAGQDLVRKAFNLLQPVDVPDNFAVLTDQEAAVFHTCLDKISTYLLQKLPH
jgi:DNA-binding MarR family transcriptional regulator